MVGKTLGHYKILEPLGKGGMGEVYRARDTKLDRDVAIKVLPEDFATDPDRLARFEREAKLLASLNHANIAAIYGLEDEGDQRFIVMEVVEGETLAERIASSGRIEVDEALDIARQIAEALEAAHENGVIHRDLKPANVVVTPEGKAKVLDFGLAKSTESDAKDVDLSHSPTLIGAATQTGVILGTASYMSPEQARGKLVDKRADIWAFGCVLFEALTGRQAFPGETLSDTIATVLAREPEWERLPDTTPAGIRVLLRRCLQKDPERRLRDVGDARLEIEDALSGAAEGISAVAVPPTPQTLWRTATPWVLAALMAAAAVGLYWQRGPVQAPRQLVRTSINLLPTDVNVSFDISPDGNRIVYRANEGGEPQLYLRNLNEDEPTPIPGTEGGASPFFSPDGEQVGFLADRQLMKVRLDGVGAVPIGEISGGLRGVSWGPDGTIVFGAVNSALMKISAEGGTPEVLTTLDSNANEIAHFSPQVLPGGNAVLFAALSGGIMDDSSIVVQSLSTGERTTLVQGSNARYVSSGHLVYGRGRILYAVPFDLERLEVTGESVPVQVGVRRINHHIFHVSETGTLIYQPSLQANRRLVLVDLEGRSEPLAAVPAGVYGHVRFSPDGRQLVVSTDDGEIYGYELEQERFGLLFSSIEDAEGTAWTPGSPMWSPDGTRFAVTATAPGSGLGYETLIVTVDGRFIDHPVPSPNTQLPFSWSPDGKRLLYGEQEANGWRAWELPLEPRAEPRRLVTSDSRAAILSPDGRWLAYGTTTRVFVKPYGSPGGAQQISTDGGTAPVWSPDGRTIYYRNGEQVMAVAITTEPTFRAGAPRLLFEGPYHRFTNARAYDLSPAGQRFAMIELEETPTLMQLHLVQNWFEELKRVVSRN